MHESLVKSKEEIEIIAKGGAILRRILNAAASKVAPGVSTGELNEFVERAIADAGAVPSFKGYGPRGNEYPAALCTSVNDVVVHGIPSKDRVLESGDIIGLDLGIVYQGLFTDAALTVPVGKVTGKKNKLIETTRTALKNGIKEARPGNRVGAISAAIQRTAEKEGFSVIRDLVGHGVGYGVHEEPAIPCFGRKEEGIILKEGMVLAIEPMVCEGGWRVIFEDDGWTVRTTDGLPSAHFEHTVTITSGEPRILA